MVIFFTYVLLCEQYVMFSFVVLHSTIRPILLPHSFFNSYFAFEFEFQCVYLIYFGIFLWYNYLFGPYI